jgi:GT2 family glycosyltransferase
MNPRLSVIIPCYNAERTLAAQLDALMSQRWTETWDVLLVDNRSTDGSLDVARRYLDRLPGLQLLVASAEQGQPYALNTGVAAATGASVAFCDADDVVGEGWLAAMGEALKTHPVVASRFDTEKLNPPWLWKSRGNPQRTGLNVYRYPPYLPHAGGGGLGMRRDLFLRMGGFDRTLPLLHDTDFCWRLQLSGVPLYFAPEAVMHIRFREDLPAIYRQARSYAEYNVLLYTRYRSRGMPKLGWHPALAAWGRLAREAIFLRSRRDVAYWLWQCGWRVGRVQGSLKHRVMAL